MEKVDYKKELKHLYHASTNKVEVINVPPMNFLMIDGRGNPNTSKSYQNSVEALFKVSYILKFMIKKSHRQIDYGVLPLEGLWWTENMADFSVEEKDKWQWTSMIMQPKLVTNDMVDDAIEKLYYKTKLDSILSIRFAKFKEGKSAQIMDIGPFSEEGPTIEKLHNYIIENEYGFTGKHHEIYLSDIRRAKPEKWKTIIRQPIK